MSTQEIEVQTGISNYLIKSILTPRINPLILNGSVYYNDKERCNNIIRLKKDLIKEFSQLKDKNYALAYRMELYNNTKQIIDRILELSKEGKLPILFFFYHLLR